MRPTVAVKETYRSSKTDLQGQNRPITGVQKTTRTYGMRSGGGKRKRQKRPSIETKET